MKFVLFRDAPLRPLYANGVGFQRPRHDEVRPLWLFSSEASARAIQRTLRHDAGGFVQCAPAKRIRARMKEEWGELPRLSEGAFLHGT